MNIKEEELLQEGLKPAFGSPGEKFFIAGKLVKMIPEHSVYVEPFIGGGSVFFRKKPSGKEVINDLDKDIVFLYRFLKSHTEEDIKILKRMNWVISKEKFLKFREKIKGGESLSKQERFFMLMNLKAYSDAGEMKTFDDRKTGRSLQILSRMSQIKERLKNTIIENADYKEIVKKYDSSNTFFYIDPPYPKAQMSWKFMPKQEEIEATIKSIKGKFLLSYEVTRKFDGFKKQIIMQRNIANPLKPQTDFKKKEHLISNYTLRAYDDFVYESITEGGYSWALQTDEGDIERAIEFFKENKSPIPAKIMENRLKESQHRRDQCMDCSKPPTLEVLWAEGMGHAWFCNADFRKWLKEHKDDIDYVKKVRNGEAAKKFQDNSNPNIKNQAIKEAKISVDFVLQHMWWKGPMEHWDLRIDTGKPGLMHAVLEHNLLEQDEVSFRFKSCKDKDWMKRGAKVERIEAGEPGNPTKNVPAWITLLDKGEAVILEDKETLKKIRFTGKKLTGLWIAKRESSKTIWWVLKKSESSEDE